MKFPVFTTRQWIGIGLCLLGFCIPTFVIIYCILRYKAQPYSYPQILGLLLYQWLPVTALLWLAAAYVFPDGRWHLLAWIVFGLTALVSIVFYLLMLGYSHS
jgi:hypothetical protein